MSATLKITFRGETRRLQVSEELTFPSLLCAVEGTWPDIRPGIEAGLAKYKDEEQDLCTLAPATFEDFLKTQAAATQGGPLLLRLEVQEALAPRPAAAAKKPRVVDPAGGGRQPAAGSPCEVDGGSGEAPAPPLTNYDEAILGDEASRGPWCGASWPKARGLVGPKKLVWLFQRLRQDGRLTPGTMASLLVHALPVLRHRIARKGAKINHLFRANPRVREIVKLLKDCAATTPGLEHFEAPLAEILKTGESAGAQAEEESPGLASGGSSAPALGETLLQLLEALQSLGRQAQADFFRELAKSLLPLLSDPAVLGGFPLVARPNRPLVHPGVRCGACGAEPLPGPCFRCAACEDFSLCGECYPKGAALHAACRAAEQDFLCILGPGAKGRCGCWSRAASGDKGRASGGRWGFGTPAASPWVQWGKGRAWGPAWFQAQDPHVGAGAAPSPPCKSWPFTEDNIKSTAGGDVSEDLGWRYKLWAAKVKAKSKGKGWGPAWDPAWFQAQHPNVGAGAAPSPPCKSWPFKATAGGDFSEDLGWRYKLWAAKVKAKGKARGLKGWPSMGDNSKATIGGDISEDLAWKYELWAAKAKARGKGKGKGWKGMHPHHWPCHTPEGPGATPQGLGIHAA